MNIKAPLLAAVISTAAIISAQAGTISVGPFGSDQLTASISNPGFSLGDFGTSTTDGLHSTAPIQIANSGSITFSPDSALPQAGVYSGNIGGVVASPLGNSRENYLAAQISDPVTINLGKTSKTFSLLWGSVDAYNSLNLDFYVGSFKLEDLTITGTQVATAVGGSFVANGGSSAYVTIHEGLLQGFDRIVATSTNAAFEFVPSVQVPEPASVALLGAGLLGFGFFSRRRGQV